MREKKEVIWRVVVICVVILLNVGFTYGWAQGYFKEKLQERSQRRGEIMWQNEIERRSLMNQQAYAENLRELETLVQEKQAVPGAELTELILEISEKMSEYQLRQGKFELGEKKMESEAFTNASLILTGVGRYTDIIAYLQTIEALPYHVLINTLTLTQTTDQTYNLDLTLTILIKE